MTRFINVERILVEFLWKPHHCSVKKVQRIRCGMVLSDALWCAGLLRHYLGKRLDSSYSAGVVSSVVRTCDVQTCEVRACDMRTNEVGAGEVRSCGEGV